MFNMAYTVEFKNRLPFLLWALQPVFYSLRVRLLIASMNFEKSVDCWNADDSIVAGMGNQP